MDVISWGQGQVALRLICLLFGFPEVTAGVDAGEVLLLYPKCAGSSHVRFRGRLPPYPSGELTCVLCLLLFGILECADTFKITYLAAIELRHEFITTTTPSQPSAYAAQRTRSSRWLVIGTRAPCSIGLASTGVLLLGNRFGSSARSAVPSV